MAARRSRAAQQGGGRRVRAAHSSSPLACRSWMLRRVLTGSLALAAPLNHHPKLPTHRWRSAAARMSLSIQLTQQVDCQDVVSIAKQACEAILQVYNSEVRSPSAGLLRQPGSNGDRSSGCPQAAGSGATMRPPDGRLWTRPPAACPPRSCCCCCCVQTESWNVEHKADESPLTRADKEANAVICDGLARIGGCCSSSAGRHTAAGASFKCI